MFPPGMRIGIKQPYMKITYSGILQLRNDNPANVILGEVKRSSGLGGGLIITPEVTKNKGNFFFKHGEY
jgi:hypothetical protein